MKNTCSIAAAMDQVIVGIAAVAYLSKVLRSYPGIALIVGIGIGGADKTAAIGT